MVLQFFLDGLRCPIRRHEKHATRLRAISKRRRRKKYAPRQDRVVPLLGTSAQSPSSTSSPPSSKALSSASPSFGSNAFRLVDSASSRAPGAKTPVRQWCSESDDPFDPLCIALQTGSVPDGSFEDGETELCLRLAAEGVAPAPWTLGHSSASSSDEGSYAYAWVSWVIVTFDDPHPWQRYLSRSSCVSDWLDCIKDLSKRIT